MTIQERITADIPMAMKTQNTALLETLRSLSTALKRKSTKPMSDEEVIPILKTQANQRKESVAAYEIASRHDLAVKEEIELEFIQLYLPEQLAGGELEIRVKEIMRAFTLPPKNSGACVGMVMKELKGQADGKEVRAIVESVLGL